MSEQVTLVETAHGRWHIQQRTRRQDMAILSVTRCGEQFAAINLFKLPAGSLDTFGAICAECREQAAV